MKPFSENDLIAYHLHELSPRRARALERALQADPSLAAESAAYAAMLRSFKGALQLDVDEDIVERNWSRVWSKLPRQPLRSVAFSRWLIPALAGLGIAFAATSVFIAVHRHAATTSTASLHRPKDAASSIRSSESPFPTAATASRPDTEQREMRQEPAPLSISRTTSPMNQPHNAAPRIASAPRGSGESGPVVRFIPLARGLVPLLPEQNLPSVDIQPVVPLQVSGSNSHFKPNPQRNFVHRDHSMDVTLAMGGVLIGTRDFSSNGATYSQGATHAVSAIASFHQQLRPAIGYRVAVSYARPDFQYESGSGQSQINGRIYEVAGTYVFQGPHSRILRTTVEAGAGLMAFLPTVKSSDTSYNLRGAAIVGVGADFAVTKHMAIHTSYRMQVFKGPDFQSKGNAVPVITTTLISNEPTVGVTYRFLPR